MFVLLIRFPVSGYTKFTKLHITQSVMHVTARKEQYQGCGPAVPNPGMGC